MNIELIVKKLSEQNKVYLALKNGDTSKVKYKELRDEKWGISDENYLNRMRLTYYILYAHIEDEEAVEWLFREELKDRKGNSFQGIGNTLNVLTFILNRYNNDGKYNEIFEEAKNANFDCSCGFDKDFQIDESIESLDLMDCIYLSQDLDYHDVMEVLVNQWKESIEEWTDGYRNTLIRFNSFLGNEQENETLYLVKLENAIASGKSFNIVSAYNEVIQYYISTENVKKAGLYFRQMIGTTDFCEMITINIFREVLEECFDIISIDVNEYSDLWKWAKPYLKKQNDMYGNLYIKSIFVAKKVKDSYAMQLEREYADWKRKFD